MFKEYKKYVILFSVLIVVLLPGGFSRAFDGQPFLYLPFSYKSYRAFHVSEGRWYSGSTGYLNQIGTGEYFIHGIKQHSAIDYALPYGTPVLAPMDGYLIASYHNVFLKEKGYFRLHQGIQLHFGLGWYVQIRNPNNDIFVVLGHLSSIDENLPVSPPYPTWGKKGISRRDPTGITSNIDTLQRMLYDTVIYPSFVYVKRGQRIGTVGVSGIEWDNEMKTSLPIPRTPDYPQSFSWDEPHIHLEVFTVVDGKKQLIDPYNIYNDFRGYPDGNTVRTRLGKVLFKQTEKGRIQFADEK